MIRITHLKNSIAISLLLIDSHVKPQGVKKLTQTVFGDL
ncbi:Uncharacterised protein [Serratia fonticola]|nr:Uncharacterised protein [Serratia fonticola]